MTETITNDLTEYANSLCVGRKVSYIRPTLPYHARGQFIGSVENPPSGGKRQRHRPAASPTSLTTAAFDQALQTVLLKMERPAERVFDLTAGRVPTTVDRKPGTHHNSDNKREGTAAYQRGGPKQAREQSYKDKLAARGYEPPERWEAKLIASLTERELIGVIGQFILDFREVGEAGTFTSDAPLPALYAQSLVDLFTQETLDEAVVFEVEDA